MSRFTFFVLSLALCGVNSVVFSTSWREVSVANIVDNQTLLLEPYEIISIDNVITSKINTKQRDEKVAARSLRNFLQTIKGQKIRIKIGKNDQKIILEDGQDLRLVILKNGWGRYLHGNKKTKNIFYEAQENAKKGKKGIWKSTDQDRFLSYFYRNGWHQKARKKFREFLQPTSVGVVTKVISGNEILVDGDISVRLIGIKIPPEESQGTAHTCFREKSKDFLSKTIEGKMVWLIKDRTQINDYNSLDRYVFLPDQKKTLKISANQEPVFINKLVLKNGFGKWEKNVNTKYEKTLQKAFSPIYKKPTGAWKECLAEIAKNDDRMVENIIKTAKEDKKTTIETLKYDEKCPIKGTTSGTKKGPIKRYHTPKSGWYKRLKNPRCFTNEAEAKEQGFVKVK